MPRILRRALAALIAFALVALSPGLAPYEAAARDMSSSAPAAPSISVVPRLNSVALPSYTKAPGSSARTLSGVAAIKAAAGVQAAPSARTATAAAGASARTRASAETAQLTTDVAAVVDGLGNAAVAAPGQTRDAGSDIQALIGGGHRAEASGMVFANPAGRDSIAAPAARLAARSGTPQGPSATQSEPPQPPAPPITPNGGGNGGDGRGNGPERMALVPRLFTSALILAGLGYFIVAPLFAAGLIGATVMAGAAAVSLAAMPFMSQRSNVVLRELPGILLLPLAFSAIASGIFAGGALAPILMGAAILPGAYGYMRFAAGKSDKAHDSWLLVTTFFGVAAAVSGAGLTILGLSAAIGTVAQYATYAAYPVMLLTLYMHLPGWVGAAIESAFNGVYRAVEDAVHVALSISRDTSAGRRLRNFSQAAVDASSWNVIWLGLIVWLPVGIVETVKAVLGAAVGLVNGVLRAPFFALWGASHKIAPESAATRFFAGWARGAASFDKVGSFNALEEPFVAGANSGSRLKRWGAEIAVSFVQVLWLVASPFAQLLNVLRGLAAGARETGKPYDMKVHDPRYFNLERDPLNNSAPVPAKPEVKVTWPGKAMATLVGLAPLWLTTGLLAEGLLGWLAIATAGAVALMPLMSNKLGAGVLKAPGILLSATGLFGAWGAVQALMMGLPGMGPIIALSLLAVLGGQGLRGLIDDIEDPSTKSYKLNEIWYTLGFASAVAMIGALAASFTGLAGLPLYALLAPAFVLSPALLVHLPRSFWSGVWGSARGFWDAPWQIHGVAGFWHKDSQFLSNVGSWFGYWTKKNPFYGVMFIFVAPFLIAMGLLEMGVSLAIGLAVGLVRAPQRFVWSASYRRYNDRQSKLDPAQRMQADDAWWPRFWSGFNKFLIDNAEGSKKDVFLPKIKKLLPYMNEKSDKTSRPTFGALLGLTGGAFVALYWTLRTLLLVAFTPLLAIPAIFAGRKAANAAMPKDAYELSNEIRPRDY